MKQLKTPSDYTYYDKNSEPGFCKRCNKKLRPIGRKLLTTGKFKYYSTCLKHRGRKV
jgi:hypothetical protein